ncbi:hypothetical protein NPIL_456531 [Nephila pilipes]|uniref:Uncharacterized protein n=1 Tax=Nephila pilipes TaxID=299642 RepID=A0A8X6MMZ8_NEPPI|nr:hypothetical protein NPIL_456531 [Nephila pilipes]
MLEIPRKLRTVWVVLLVNGQLQSVHETTIQDHLSFYSRSGWTVRIGRFCSVMVNLGILWCLATLQPHTPTHRREVVQLRERTGEQK